MATAADGPTEASAVAPDENAETLVWSGTMTGSSDPQLSKLALFREGRHAIPIDMLGVEETDVVASLQKGDLKGKQIGTQWRVTRAAIDAFLGS